MTLSEEQQKEYDNFVHNVRYLRFRHHLSKKAMAKILGIGINSLGKIERGKLPKNITVRVFFRVHQHFGVPPQYQLTYRMGDANKETQPKP